MKKLLFIVGIFFAVGLMFRSVSAEQGSTTKGQDGRYFMYLTASSGTILSDGGVIYSVHMSSGQDNTFVWLQLISTRGAGAGVQTHNDYADFGNASKMTPPMIFLSSPTVSPSNVLSSPLNQKIELGGGHGLRSGTTIQYFKSAGASGHANTFVVEWGF